MARRTPAPPQPKPAPELTISREEAKQKLQSRIEKGRELRERQVTSREAFESLKADYRKWDDFNAELLRRIFTTDELADEYSRWGSVGIISMHGPTLGKEIADKFEDIETKVQRLDSIVERLELIPLHSVASAQELPHAPAPSSQAKTNKVFVVHGHDDAAKTGLEIFLREIGLEPVVLHRQPDEGQTVIEKFEKHGDVGYAFVLLTPDDIGYAAIEDGKTDDARAKERRARQNVIFEFGYFVGKLSRSRVCCLYRGDVTLPSDLGGLVYKKYQTTVEEVALPILRDLKAAGYSVTL